MPNFPNLLNQYGGCKMFNKFYDYVEKMYRNNIYPRADDTGAVFYYSQKDFPGLFKREYPFKSSLGHKLAGCLYYREGYIKDRIVVFDHGMGSGHTGYMKEINLLTEHGFLVFAYDHTGCMESGGETTGGFCQSLIDLDDALTTLKNDDEFKDLDFSVMGHSWGAYSTVNIAAFHPDISHLVAMAAFISFPEMLGQSLGGMMKKAGERIYENEKKQKPRYVDANAIDALKNTNAKALLIHSKDDPMVSYEKNFEVMKKALADKDNITFYGVDGKRHNPNYTRDAVVYKDAFFETYKKALKKNKLSTDEEKKKFKNSFDWERMTAQDEEVWKVIFDFLDK